MGNKIIIAALAAAAFALSVVQNVVIARDASAEVASVFFYLQSMMLFAVAVGGSTIMVKNFYAYANKEKMFNAGVLLNEVVVTALVAAAAASYIRITSNISDIALFAFVLMCALQANITIVSFLRIFDDAFRNLQYLRVGMLFFKTLVFVLLPLERAGLTVVLLVFIISDAISYIIFLLLLRSYKSRYRLCWNVDRNIRNALSWGSVNAAFRNLPRTLVFIIATQLYTAQEVINLRMLLLPRDYLASMMSVLNVVFYKEIIERGRRFLFVALTGLSFAFQFAFFFGLSFTDADLALSLDAVVFYMSASAVYGVSQQHWKLIAGNQENRQLLITVVSFTAMGLMALFMLGVGWRSSPINYLTFFNAVWVVLIFLFSAGRTGARQGSDDLRKTGW